MAVHFGNYSGGGGSIAPQPIQQKIVVDTADSFYVVASNLRGTAFAHYFIRNVGGSAGTDTGAPYQPWRYSGTAEIASFATSPTDAGRLTYSNDIGAFDYAFQASGKYMGNYHGGEVINTETIKIDGVDVSATVNSAIGKRFELSHTSTITSGTNIVTTTLSVTVNGDGSLNFEAGPITSAQSFTQVFVGMIIGTGLFDEIAVRLQGGSNDIAVPVANGTTYLGNVTGFTMRSAANGRKIAVTSNVIGNAKYRRTKIVRDDLLNRSKFYYEYTTGALGTLSAISWTMDFQTGAAGATGFAANLLTNPNFDTNLAGWTATHNPSGIAWNAGAARFTRSATLEGRLIQGVATEIGGVYLLSAKDTSSNGQGYSYLGLTSNSNGSTASPAPALAPNIPNEAGFMGHLVIATQATSYAMAVQTLGTAGQTTDFDNMSLIKLADNI